MFPPPRHPLGLGSFQHLRCFGKSTEQEKTPDFFSGATTLVPARLDGALLGAFGAGLEKTPEFFSGMTTLLQDSVRVGLTSIWPLVTGGHPIQMSILFNCPCRSTLWRHIT